MLELAVYDLKEFTKAYNILVNAAPKKILVAIEALIYILSEGNLFGMKEAIMEKLTNFAQQETPDLSNVSFKHKLLLNCIKVIFTLPNGFANALSNSTIILEVDIEGIKLLESFAKCFKSARMLLYVGFLYSHSDTKFTDYNIAIEFWRLAKQRDSSNDGFSTLIKHYKESNNSYALTLEEIIASEKPEINKRKTIKKSSGLNLISEDFLKTMTIDDKTYTDIDLLPITHALETLQIKTQSLSSEIQMLLLSNYSKEDKNDYSVNQNKIDIKQIELQYYNEIYTYFFKHQYELCQFDNFSRILIHIQENIKIVERASSIMLPSLKDAIDTLVTQLPASAPSLIIEKVGQ